MTQLRALFMRFLGLFNKACNEQDMTDEIEATLELEFEERIRSGMTSEEARRAALMNFGSVEATKEAIRARRTIPLVETLIQDIFYGVRVLLQNPRFTVVGLLTIVITVGGITTIFTLVNSILLKPLPYPEPDRLVHITQTSEERPGGSYVSVADFLDFQREAISFETVAAYTNSIYDMEADEPYTVMQWDATPDVFPLLGIRVALGRGLQPEDMRLDAPEVAVLSHEFWLKHAGARENVIGTRLRLPRRSSRIPPRDITIVGVMAEGFKPPLPGRSAAAHVAYPSLWMPLRVRPGDLNRTNRGMLTVVARLRPGISIEAAREDLGAITKRLASDYPDTHRERSALAGFVLDDVVESVAPTLRIFFGAVSCVLLIGVANLVSLQFVRNSSREREITIRAALGAARPRLIHQLLVESLILSSTGGVLGLFVAWAGTMALIATLPERFPRADGIGLDFSVFLFGIAVSTVVGIVVGMLPALRVSRLDFQAAINEGSRTATIGGRRGRIQRSLIAFETALAFVLLVGAALLTNSLWRLLATDTAIQEENLWTINVELPNTYRTTEQARHFWLSALKTVRSFPQVELAAMTNAEPPLSGGDITLGSIFADGSPQDPRQTGASFSSRVVSADFFKTLGVRLLAGRPILESDTVGGEKVVVLNETAARTLWPDDDAIGRRLRFGSQTMMTVVGVIPNFKHRRLDQQPFPQMYTSYLQDFVYQNFTVMIRLKPELRRLPDAIPAALSNLEGKANLTVASMDDIRWTLVAPERFRTAILVIFALGATFLAMVGIFGVVSFSVVQRHREIGLRMALGAAPGDVVRLMARQALLPAGIGLAAGLIVSAGLSRILSSFLFELQARDPLTFGIAFSCLLAAALLASFIPARKAIRGDPMVALRWE